MRPDGGWHDGEGLTVKYSIENEPAVSFDKVVDVAENATLKFELDIAIYKLSFGAIHTT